MLDNVIIQEGDFTDDYFNKNEWWKDLPEVVGSGPTIASNNTGKLIDYEQALLQAEDESDAAAAIAARKELNMDENEFDENRQIMSDTPSGPASPFTPTIGSTPTRQVSVCNDTEGEDGDDDEEHDVIAEEEADVDEELNVEQQPQSDQDEQQQQQQEEEDDENMQLDVGHVDQYMLQFWEREMVGTNLGFGGFPDE